MKILLKIPSLFYLIKRLYMGLGAVLIRCIFRLKFVLDDRWIFPDLKPG